MGTRVLIHDHRMQGTWPSFRSSFPFRRGEGHSPDTTTDLEVTEERSTELTMQMTQTEKNRRGLSDRSINRLIVGIVVVLAIGIPLVGVIYFLDRNTSAGPSMAERAIAAAEDAVRTSPNDVTARMALATSYVADQRVQDAIAQYSEVLTVVPDHHGALLARGNAYVAVKDDADATKDFQKLVGLANVGDSATADPQLEEAYFRLGEIAYRAGSYADAVTQATNALRINQSDADAMNLLGAALVKTGKASDAVSVLKEAVAFVPVGWCDPYQHLAEAYTALGNADGVAYANGMVAFCTAQPDVAVAALTPLTAGPFALDATLGLAMIAEQQGDAATATSMYEKVLAKDPQNTNAVFGMQRLAAASAHPATSSAPGAGGAPAASPSAGANP